MEELAKKLTDAKANADACEKKLVKFLADVLGREIEITEKFSANGNVNVTIEVRSWDKTSLKMMLDDGDAMYQVVSDNQFHKSYSNALSVPMMLYFIITSDVTRCRFDDMSAAYLKAICAIEHVEAEILGMVSQTTENEKPSEN